MTGKITLCPECALDGGWHYPEDGEPFRPHHEALNPDTARDESLALVEAANPSAFRDAYRIIAYEAEVSQWLSANSTRAAMETAQIPGPVIGAAFKKAAAEGLIEAEGYVPSTQPETKSHPIRQYRSRSFSRQLGVS